MKLDTQAIHKKQKNANRSRIIITTRRRHPSSNLSISLSCTTRRYTTTTRPIVHIPAGSCIYAFGAPSHTRTPLLRDVDWTVNDGEAWAIISSGGGGRGKHIIFNVKSFLIFSRYSFVAKTITGEVFRHS